MFTVHLHYTLYQIILDGKTHRERKRLSMASLSVFIHITDMLESLWLGGFVFSNQQ